MAKIQTVGTVSEFISGEYKVKEARKRQLRKQKAQKVVSIAGSMAIPVALGSPLGAVAVGLFRATDGLQVMGNPNTLTASAEAVPVMGDAIKQKVGEEALSGIAHALDPIIDILVALSFPVASVVIVGGCFWFMFGNSDRAWRTIQNGALGYVLIQLAPFMLEVLKNVGSSI